MKRSLSLKREQSLVAALLLVGGAGSLGLLLFGTLPLRDGKNGLLAQHVRLERQLAEALAEPDAGPSLQQRLVVEQAEHAALQAEWERLKSIVQTFGEAAQPTDFLATARESRIDFKIELFNARQRLAAEARRLGVEIPQDLGLTETISAIEDAETRFWQLMATDKLVATLLQSGIAQVLEIRPLPARTHDLSSPDDARLREYPVSVTITCSYSSLLQLLDRIGTRGSFFALRAIRIEQDALEPGTLRVQMTCGASILGAAAPAARSDSGESRLPRRREAP